MCVCSCSFAFFNWRQRQQPLTLKRGICGHIKGRTDVCLRRQKEKSDRKCLSCNFTRHCHLPTVLLYNTCHFISPQQKERAALQNASFHFQRQQKLQGVTVECFLPVWVRLQMTCLNSALAVCNLLTFKGSVFYIVCKNPFWVNFLQMKAICTMVLLHCIPTRKKKTLLKSLVHMNFTHSCFAKCLNYLI